MSDRSMPEKAIRVMIMLIPIALLLVFIINLLHTLSPVRYTIGRVQGFASTAYSEQVVFFFYYNDEKFEVPYYCNDNCESFQLDDQYLIEFHTSSPHISDLYYDKKVNIKLSDNEIPKNGWKQIPDKLICR